jgi:hypothetical protein
VNPVDATTWQALGVTLTVIGLLLSLLVWRRRGAGSGLRGVAWSLLPAAAGFTGTLRLLWEIGDSVVRWAGRLVFSPLMWFGIALAGVSVVLFGVSAAVRARQPARSRRTRRSAPERSASREARTGRLPSASSRRAASPPTGATGDVHGADSDDMADIEAILRKHGIS